MDIYVEERPLMSDAQFRALQAVDQRAGAVDVLRWRDCSITTLLSMAGLLGRTFKHAPWVTVQYTNIQKGKRLVRTLTHATLTPTGINALDAERTRRERKAAHDARMAALTTPRSITHRADPFALVASQQADIPF